MAFALDFLASYDDESLLVELRRVSALVPGKKLSRKSFDTYSKVSASAVGKRFGSWRIALERAGLEDRFEASYLRKSEASTLLSKEQLLSTVQDIAKKLGHTDITVQEFWAHTGVRTTRYIKLFGSWKHLLLAAGFEQTPLGRRYTDEDCFENLLAVWTEYGRAPQHDEMNEPPSMVGSKAYVRRWGTWRKALAAFVTRVNQPVEIVSSEQLPAEEKPPEPGRVQDTRGRRDVPLGLRYFILKRDSFRCVRCGRSPATEHGLVLHVDHILAWANGGLTVADNLRTLCAPCNLGKGDRLESEI